MITFISEVFFNKNKLITFPRKRKTFFFCFCTRQNIKHVDNIAPWVYILFTVNISFHVTTLGQSKAYIHAKSTIMTELLSSFKCNAIDLNRVSGMSVHLILDNIKRVARKDTNRGLSLQITSLIFSVLYKMLISVFDFCCLSALK